MPERDFNNWLRDFTPQNYFSLIENAFYTTVTVGLPKFELEFSYELSSQLEKIGLASAFDEHGADFSRIGTSGRNIYLTDIPHRAYLKVDEEGAIAVAITMPSLGCISAMPTEVIFDRPFLYAIIENNTSLPLFIGIMNDPTIR